MLNWLNCLSLYWITVIYGAVIYVYFVLGYVPQYGNPDPKEIITNFYFFHTLFSTVIPYFLITLIINILFVLNIFLKTKIFRVLPSFILLLASILFFGLVMSVDPGGYLDWFLD